nr:ribonuclease H-like domain-containing protein [Tanacetum cinerariifolium]
MPLPQPPSPSNHHPHSTTGACGSSGIQKGALVLIKTPQGCVCLCGFTPNMVRFGFDKDTQQDSPIKGASGLSVTQPKRKTHKGAFGITDLDAFGVIAAVGAFGYGFSTNRDKCYIDFKKINEITFQTTFRVYFDDIVVTGNNKNEIDKFKSFLSIKFMIKDLGQLKYFLGIKVLENKSGMCLSQRKYYLELLSEYGLLACKRAATPLQQNVVLSYEKSKTTSAISIAENPVFHEKTKHFEIDLHLVRDKVFDGVVKVLKVTSASNVADIFTKGLSIAQHNKFCKNSDLLICSSHEPERVCWKYATSAISIAENPVFHEKTKHFEIDLHLVRDKVFDGVVKVLKVTSASNVADIFTKGLSIAQHNKFCKNSDLLICSSHEPERVCWKYDFRAPGVKVLGFYNQLFPSSKV